MNLFSSFLKLFSTAGLSNLDQGRQIGSSGGVSTDSGVSVNDERAMALSSVWACTQYIVNSVCSLPLNFYQQTRDGRQELSRDHYLKQLFHRSPNVLMKPRDFRKAMTTQLVLWSNAYAEIFWQGERPVAIVPLRPGRMTPYLDGGELTYHYQMQQGVRILSKRSVLHLKGLGTDGIVGLERNDYARESYGLSVSADTYAAKQFANGGRSGGGYLMFDQWLTQTQREQARDLYEGMSEGSFNKGKLWILEGGVKYQGDTVNPDTMQMIETRKMQVSEIARFFGVPEVMIGGGGATSAWPASFEQQLLSFLTFTLQDYVDEWEHAIKESLITDRNVFADHDTTGFVKMDSTAKAQLHASWVQNGLKTRNEIRKINNDPPVEGGDELTIQVNLAPVDQIGVEQDQSDNVDKSLALHAKSLDDRMQLFESKMRNIVIESTKKPDQPPVAIRMPDIEPAVVHVTNDIHVPQADTPVVNVSNEIAVPEAPAPMVNVTSPEVRVDNIVETPKVEVQVDNQVDVPATGKRKVKFNRDSKGDIAGAEIDG